MGNVRSIVTRVGLILVAGLLALALAGQATEACPLSAALIISTSASLM